MPLIISGIIDGPLTGGVPKAVELTVLADVPDLSVYGLESANNGAGATGAEFAFPAVAASAGDVLYVASEAPGFEEFFGFAPDYVSSALSVNGDDAILLYEGGTVVDVFGEPDVDGSGTAWDYLDGWAYRVPGSASSPVFAAAAWTFSGVDALDGATSNASATTPFPAGSFAGPAGPVVVAAEDFDGGAVRLVSGFDQTADNLDGGPGDWFGVSSIGAWSQASGVPFSLTDDSVADVSGAGVMPGDLEGVFGQNADPENDFFALSDSDAFGALQTATWSFDILGFEDLALSIAMGGISDLTFDGFAADTDVRFTVTIDGGPEQMAFDLDAVDAGAFVTRPMDGGAASGGGRVLTVGGDNAVTKYLAEDGGAAPDAFLDKAALTDGAIDTFQTALDGTGLTATLTMSANVPFEAMAFDDILITGTATPAQGSGFSIAALDATKAEGDLGTTAFTFTVSRSGDVSGTSSVDFAVTGATDTADFGGVLPSGTVSFAAGEAQKTVTLLVSGDVDQESDEDFAVTLSNPVGGTITAGSADGRIVNDDLTLSLVHDVQGNAATWGEQFGRTDATPFFGGTIMVSAVVVGDFQIGDADNTRNLGGLYLQEEDADADADATTSEGIYVFEGSGGFLTDVDVGDRVTVVGTATESFGETQIVATEIIVESSGNALPTAAAITFPIAGILENPDGQLIADLEAYEGMLVNIPQDMTVADLFDYGRFGEIGLYADGRLAVYTEGNEPDAAGFQTYLGDAVRNTVTLNDGLSNQNPAVLPYPDGAFGASDGLSSGDTMSGVTGVVRYSRSSGASGDENYRINPIEAPVFTDTSPRAVTPPDVGGSLKVASFNVLNYFNGDGMGGGFPTSRGASSFEEFQRQQDKLVAAISEIDADAVGLIEIENDGYGPTSAVAALVGALNAAMGTGTYAYLDPGVPQLGSDEIAVGFIYKPGTVGLSGGAAILDKTVDPRFDSDNQRPSLAQTFEELASGETFTAVVNHLKSKGSPVEGTPGDEDQGDGAGNANTTRTLAAQALTDWIASDPTDSGDDDVLVIGDLNAYAMETPIRTLLAGADTQAGTADDMTRLTEDYTYGFPADLVRAGQVQAFGALDHAIGTTTLAAQVTGAAAWHLNADEPGLIDYNLEFKPANPSLYAPDAFASSDHDPVVVGLDLAPDGHLARLDFLGRFPREQVIYSLDGEEISRERLRLLSDEIEIEDAGISIDASSGRRLPAFLSASGEGLGVASIAGLLGGKHGRIDGAERLEFSLDKQDSLGDSLSVAFDFADVRGSGQVRLSFYDDGALIEAPRYALDDGALAVDLAGRTDFDRVDLEVTGGLQVSVSAVEFFCTEADSFDLA